MAAKVGGTLLAIEGAMTRMVTALIRHLRAIDAQFMLAFQDAAKNARNEFVDYLSLEVRAVNCNSRSKYGTQPTASNLDDVITSPCL